jgi:hypothetical protein
MNSSTNVITKEDKMCSIEKMKTARTKRLVRKPEKKKLGETLFRQAVQKG